jgi:hypothetical protein
LPARPRLTSQLIHRRIPNAVVQSMNHSGIFASRFK